MVDWSFQLQVFGKWGFGSRWISWMCGLLASGTTRVLVNGTSRSTLVCTSGLRQGDPLSPMIFILVMVVMH